MYLFSFEKLQVWQESRQWVKELYLVLKEFPPDEKFGLISQIKLAAVSVSSNIAEGATRTSPKDQALFYQTAFGSLIEVLNQLIISVDLGFLSEETYNQLRQRIEKIGNQLNALGNRQLEKIAASSDKRLNQ